MPTDTRLHVINWPITLKSICKNHNNLSDRGHLVTRRYPSGIQWLVSTHHFQQFLDQLNPKCQDLSKSAFLGGRGGVGWWFRPTFLKYLSGGTQGILNTNFAMPYSGSPCTTDSLSHTTCVQTKKLTPCGAKHLNQAHILSASSQIEHCHV